jgi:hypothetical protein
MKVVIEFSLLEDEKHFQHLDSIFSEILERKYRIELIPNGEELENTPWYKNTRESFKKDIKEIYKRSSYNKGKNDNKIFVSEELDVNKFQYTPQKAKKILNNKFQIVVENEFSDGRFLNFCFEVFRESSKQIIENLESDYIDFCHLGGKNHLKKKVDKLLKNHLPFQIFIVLDSDKRYPDQLSPNQKLVDDLKNPNINYWILEKREIENYLPKTLLLRKLKNNPKIKSEQLNKLEILTDVQYSFFPLKKGLENETISKLKDAQKKNSSRKKAKSSDEEKVIELYGDIVDSKFLGNGFGDNLSEYFEEKYWEQDELEMFRKQNQQEIENNIKIINGILI